jgi:hypothetical protein
MIPWLAWTIGFIGFHDPLAGPLKRGILPHDTTARRTVEPPTNRKPLAMRKLIAFDDETLAQLTQLGRDRMATLQELADEAFADLLKKHGVPIDLKDALRKSARAAKPSAPDATTPSGKHPTSRRRRAPSSR